MAQNRLRITLDGPDIGAEGIPLGEFIAAAEAVQDALRLMVQHLGSRPTDLGQPPRWVRDASSLRFMGISHGSFVADLMLEPPASPQGSLEDLGGKALEALLEWDGSQGSGLPHVVKDRLRQVHSSLRDGVQVWYGEPTQPRKVQIMRQGDPTRVTAGQTDALLYGWLNEVNWNKRTAQLYDYSGDYINLRFPIELYEDMLRLATQYVEIIGTGRISARDRWTSVNVHQISACRSQNDPFDINALLSDESAKVFDPERISTASEPVDVDEFLRFTHDARDAELRAAREDAVRRLNTADA